MSARAGPCFAAETWRNTMILLNVSVFRRAPEARSRNTLESKRVSVFRVFRPYKGERRAKHARRSPLLGWRS